MSPLRAKVLVFSELFWPHVGGAEVLTARLLPVLKERGLDFHVVTSQHQRRVPELGLYRGIPIVRLPFRAALQGGGIEEVHRLQLRMVSLLKEIEPDLIHLNSVGPSAVFLLRARRAHRCPLLLTLHQQPTGNDRKEGQSLLEACLRSADRVSSVSHAVLGAARNLVPEVAGRASVIHNAIERPELAPTPLPFEPPTILGLGRLVPQKGFDLLIRAFAALRARFPDLRLCIAGAGVEKGRLRAMAADLGLGDHVSFAGGVKPGDVPALINSATALALPSRWEGLPLVAIEAAMMGRPVVATRVGGLPEAVVDGETGLLVDPDDLDGLTGALATLLSRPADARRLGAAARRRALDLFALDRCIDAYEQLYRDLLHERTCPGRC